MSYPYRKAMINVLAKVLPINTVSTSPPGNHNSSKTPMNQHNIIKSSDCQNPQIKNKKVTFQVLDVKDLSR